ncbi:MAG: HAD family phosphatase [Parvibaculum sp.]|uniref:HAD family hydrolase n=1 Tax=Parvibaculum sp. TaxID=2024848 RepID=UPI0027310097|nr:HAD family phosphatase [Parvibaculum sp.]MDP2151680.1 HAD family phosphatase [Parvibaculum sp.]
MALSFSPSLVIFDCDGVLVDTEPVANRLLVRVLAEDGFHISYDECRRLFVGRTMEAVMAHVENAIGRPLGAHWPAYIRDETLKAFAEGVQAVAGSRDVLQALRAKGIPFCVASSGKFEKMRFTLGATGLLPHVEDVLFSAEEVERGKPAPDLFLHAAARMGHAPENCLVIEDSLPGVQAAVAAGMPVIGYAGDPLTDAAALKSEGAHVVHDMSALPGLLGLK